MDNQRRFGVVKVTSSAVLFLLLGTSIAWAQLSTVGTIGGTVTDSAGAAVPAAAITITNMDSGVVTKSASNQTGSFTVVALLPGTYQVSVTKEGFKTFVETGIYLPPGQVRTVNAVLSVGAVITEVTITASAAAVQTTTHEISSFVAEEQVEMLPLNGRNFQSLAALMPGVVNLAAGNAQTPGGIVAFNNMSINGAGSSGTFYALDGIWNMNSGWMANNTITPNPDQIEEVRVLQNNYSVKWSLMGANVVLIQTKAGGDHFHGDAWEYVRNDAFDARNFFSKTVPPLKWNFWGWDLGGPFYIPGHYNTKKDKTFFYWNQQWIRQITGAVTRAATPTLAMRNGTFTTPITDPATETTYGVASTGQYFPQTSPGVYQIPQNRISPDALAFINALYLPPNLPGTQFLNYFNGDPVVIKQLDDEIKVDHNISSKLRLTAEYLDERQTQIQPSQVRIGSPFNNNKNRYTNPDQLAQIRLTQMITISMVNQVSIAMNNYITNLGSIGTVLVSQIPNLSLNLPFHGWRSNLLPTVYLGQGYPTQGASATSDMLHSSDLEDSVTDDWSMSRGNHYFQAGGTILKGTKRQEAGNNSNGSFTFSGQFTRNAIADFLLGDASSFAQVSNDPRYYVHYNLYSTYFEDRWKATRRLTLTAGMRLLFSPFGNNMPGGAAAFDPSKFDPARAPIVATNGVITPTANYNPYNGIVINGPNPYGAPIVPHNLTTAHQYYWAPSLGFAWDVFGDGKTSLRGGYGITYHRAVTGQDVAQGAPANYPLVNNITLINTNFPSPVGVGTTAPQTARSMSTENFANVQSIQIQSYSLSLEHQFGTNWYTSIAGAGMIARHLMVYGKLNQPPPFGAYQFNPILNTGTVSSAYYAPYQGYDAIRLVDTDANAYWNALEINVRHPIGHNVFFTTSYTWSHNLTNQIAGAWGSGGSTPQNPYNPRGDYGNSPNDFTHVFTTSLIYSLPWLQAAKGWKGLGGGWKISEISTIQSGGCLTVGLATTHNGLATRPDLIASLQGPKTLAQWFNTAAFAQAAPGFYGNEAPNQIRGPGLVNFDMAAYKDFRISELHKFQFRAEFFNIFNHTNFAGVSTSLGAGNFGQVTSARSPRQLEFALRYQF